MLHHSEAPNGKIPHPIKKDAEAKQAVEGFAKKGKAKAFVCGVAKMLEEKVKNTDPVAVQIAIGAAIFIGSAVTSIAVCTGVSNTINTAEAASLSGMATGAAMVVEPFISMVCNKPILLERLANISKEGIKNSVKNTQENLKNFANEAMKKGGR
ncbi:MAG: hypothetical protein KAJ75_07570 [Alphaproteobacteria bacterium]|nr:hypothetical protein [Alphaproteobacteria bacterium]